MYYLFSSHKTLLEAICVCEDEDSVATPLFQTGVYPLGTLFSKALQIIEPWANNSISPLGKNELLKKGFDNFTFPKDFSFSSIASLDPNVRKSLDLLLKSRWYLPGKRSEIEIYNLLQKYMRYIYQCQNDEYNILNNVQYLNIIVRQEKDVLPNHSIYLPDPPKDYANNINAWINKITEKPFNPTPKHFSSKRLFPLENNYPLISATKWGTLFLPLDVYEIFDIIDLLLASLTCIFEHHDLIKKCHYCKSLFVTHRSNQKYCPRESSTSNKTCQRKMNENLQNARNKYGISKKEHCLRTMYANKYGTTAEEDTDGIYKKFKEDCKNWKRKIKHGETTTEEYSAWLESKYTYKYKNK